MKHSINISNIIATFGAVIVNASPILAHASLQCESVFKNPTFLRESLNSARSATNATNDLLTKYKKNPQELTVDEVRSHVSSITRKSHQYFSEAGIQSQVHMALFKFKNLKDAKEFVISYPVSTLTGSRTGDEVARLINGIHSNPKYSKHPVRVEYDPLYLFRNDSLGHYESEGNKISIGPHVVTDEVIGISNTLRHEAQHYMEQMKIYSNQMTMARISFSGGPKNKDPYGNFFRMDELETHLRDIRTLLNFKARIQKDKILLQTLDTDILARLKGHRPLYIEDKMTIMASLISKSEAMMAHLKTQLAKQSPDQIINTKMPGESMAVYLVEDLPFSIVRVNLYGLYDKPQYELTRGEIQQGLEKAFIWQGQRLQAIKNEFESLQRSYRTP